MPCDAATPGAGQQRPPVNRLTLLALGLSAVALRPQLAGIAPLLPSLKVDLHTSHAASGLLATIPIFCMGLFAPPAPYLAHRIGVRAALGLCVAAIGCFGLLRAGAPTTAAILVATVPIGIAMGLAGALVPIAVEERLHTHPVLSSGVFAIGLNVGATASAAGAVPLAHVFGWRGALVAFSTTTLMLVVPWLVLVRPAGRSLHVAHLPSLPLRRPIAWALTAFYGLDALVFFGLTTWLSSVYVERGWTLAEAGRLLAAFQFASIPGTAAVSLVADRIGSRRLYLVGGSALIATGVVGLRIAPEQGYVWAALSGFALGAVAPILFALPLDLAEHPRDVGSLAAMMLLGGSLFAALAPALLGRARDVTGSFTAPVSILGACSLLLLGVSVVLSRHGPTQRLPAP